MDTTWIEVWGITITKPVTAGTNLLLALQCVLCARWLRGDGPARRVWWGRFFAAMALATLAGVPKHGFAYLLGDAAFDAMLWISSLASGAAVYFAQRATIASRVPRHARRAFERVAEVQAAFFVGANGGLGPEMTLLIGHTAVGLLPVIAVEAVARWRGDGDGARVAVGLIVSMLTGLVYALELSLGRWFNHVDLAHALMGVSFYLILVGVRSATPARVERRAEASGRAAVAAAPVGA